MKTIDTEKIAYHIREILLALGDDPEREGLKETPQRVAKMYAEVFEGMNYTNEEIARMFDTTFEDEDYLGEQQNGKPNNMVAVTEIPIFSYCEHHMALMYNMTVSVAYLPKEKIIGLSKIARIADMVGRRLQLQGRIGTDIAEIVAMVTESEDVAVNFIVLPDFFAFALSVLPIYYVTLGIYFLFRGKDKKEFRF
jgi:GTP cyclohydrolase I